jgi:hypothetical protein
VAAMEPLICPFDACVQTSLPDAKNHGPARTVQARRCPCPCGCWRRSTLSGGARPAQRASRRRVIPPPPASSREERSDHPPRRHPVINRQMRIVAGPRSFQPGSAWRGGERNRTAVRGFAGPCLNHSATPPPGPLPESRRSRRIPGGKVLRSLPQAWEASSMTPHDS